MSYHKSIELSAVQSTTRVSLRTHKESPTQHRYTLWAVHPVGGEVREYGRDRTVDSKNHLLSLPLYLGVGHTPHVCIYARVVDSGGFSHNTECGSTPTFKANGTVMNSTVYVPMPASLYICTHMTCAYIHMHVPLHAHLHQITCTIYDSVGFIYTTSLE